MSLVDDIFKACHENMALDSLKPTNVRHVFKTRNGLYPYIYLNGFYFREMNPFSLAEFKVDAPEYAEAIKGLDIDEWKVGGKGFVEVWAEEAEKLNSVPKRGPDGWVRLFSLVAKQVGLELYIKFFETIPDDQKYESFIEVYTNSEFGFEILKDYYHKIFSYAKYSEPRKERLYELALKSGNDITIYHGAKAGEDPFNPHDEYSWTLSFVTASFFAHRHGTGGEVWTRTIKLEEAIDYLTCRNEEEILYDYQK